MNDANSTIDIYIDIIRSLYQNKDAVICWARNHSDVINTSEPLSDVEIHVKQAAATARRCNDMESLHVLDTSVYDMECVLEVLERAHKIETEWEQGKLDFIQEAI